MKPEFLIAPTAVAGEPDAHTLRLSIDNQQFWIGRDYYETKQEAEWMARQLELALNKLTPVSA